MSLSVAGGTVAKKSSLMDKPSAAVPHLRVDDEDVVQTMFKMGTVLGQGSFGIVKQAVNTSTGKKWAVKVVNKEKAGSSAVKLLEREVSILKQVNHPHIIHLEQVFETSKRMYLVMELCEEGELADLLKSRRYFTESSAIPIIRDLASAISYLHKHDIVHRDLKLENILVHTSDDSDYLHIKVTDFGLSVVKDGVGHENMMQQFCGTPIYMPPEIVDNKTYSQQCDVWAMGVITFYLLSGSPPFKARDEESLYELIKKGEINFGEECVKDCTEAAHNCIQGMLKVDPAHRLSASEVHNHRWITGLNGSNATNVLELMRQWKDELTVDDDTPEHSSTNAENDSTVETQPMQKTSGNKSDTSTKQSKKSRSPAPGHATKHINNNYKSGAIGMRSSTISNSSNHSHTSVIMRKGTHHMSPSEGSAVISTDRDGSAGKKSSVSSTNNMGYLKSTQSSNTKGSRGEKSPVPGASKTVKKK